MPSVAHQGLGAMQPFANPVLGWLALKRLPLLAHATPALS